MAPASPPNHAPNGLARLGAAERRVVESLLGGRRVSRDLNREFADTRTFGERLADRIAAFGGSWTFILIFAVLLLAWVTLNSVVLAREHRAFDPYPYILLNLVLSMLAALQAPIIMMSQNRQAARDRLAAAHDYEVNLTAEIEIRTLHDKLDRLRDREWGELVELQQEQIRMLERLLARTGGEGPRADA
jgi:uncharacterized membrane protein